jgi:serine/threonine protein phosphatase PrpC
MDNQQPAVTVESAADGAVRLANGMVGKEFSTRIDLQFGATTISDVMDDEVARQLESLGLTSTMDGGVLVLSGVALREGQHEFRFRAPKGAVAVSWFVNADPHSLWKNLEPDPSLGYRKEHAATVRLVTDEYDVVGVSRRGRAHAHDGKFREDDFAIVSVSRWIIAAVADGAGSARFSREGSRIACSRAIERLSEEVPKQLDDEFVRVVQAHAAGDDESLKQVRNLLYQVLCGAAFEAYKAIEYRSDTGSHAIKDYATTLLLAICLPIEEQTFVATFWIGDGALAILKEKGPQAMLMGRPDGGEFSGQTRFLTMSEILSDPREMMRRVEFSLEKDLVAVMLMTDGVSDPKFGTDNRLLSSEAWAEFWSEIEPSVVARDDAEPESLLLEWTDFWSAGEHDDRTLVVIRPRART